MIAAVLHGWQAAGEYVGKTGSDGDWPFTTVSRLCFQYSEGVAYWQIIHVLNMKGRIDNLGIALNLRGSIYSVDLRRCRCGSPGRIDNWRVTAIHHLLLISLL